MTEKNMAQEVCVRELIKFGLPVDAVTPSTDKIARFSPFAQRYRLGLITHSVELSQEFEDEVLAFPEGEHDDLVDALAYSLSALDSTIRAAWEGETSGYQWTPLPHERREADAEMEFAP